MSERLRRKELEVILPEELASILHDLRFCPVCGWDMITVFCSDGTYAKDCQNHNMVFRVWSGINGYEIKLDLKAPE